MKPAINSFAVSFIVHTIVLSMLAFIKFSSKPASVRATQQPAAKIKMVTRLIEKAQILPKPKIISLSLSKTGNIPRFSLNQNSNPIFPAPAEATITKSLAPENLNACHTAEAANMNFFGNTVCDKRLCFVVDCSGSMQGTFEKVKSQLKNSISSLEPDRYFQIIFFGDNQLYSFSKNGLMRASNPVKEKAAEFIDAIRPKGRTNALEALVSAMLSTDTAQNQPNAIYFLTDGFNLTEDNSNLLASILNFRSSHCTETKFNTIGFWPKQQDEIILKQLAEMTGGTFTPVNK